MSKDTLFCLFKVLVTDEDCKLEESYLVIDLKSFFASVECVERGLDPMTTRLVVADPERSDRTICLAVTPALKALGVKNRCRVYEIPKEIDYITAPPRMQKYIDYSAEIYGIYLSYFSKEDIHPYSVDEAFMYITPYLKTYGLTPKELALKIMGDIQDKLGLRATCGIGTNLYLAKIALDITAKHAEDFIGILDEKSYVETLGDHKPITDFWRVGPGTAATLARFGITTMRQVSETDENLLYKLFGIDAELLIDHSKGIEPVTIADIKKYSPRTTSVSNGQVLPCDYSYEKGRIIIKEMTENLCYELEERGMFTDSVTIMIGYSAQYNEPSAHGTTKLAHSTSVAGVIIDAAVALYDRIVQRHVPMRRINICFNKLESEAGDEPRQLSLFDNEDEIVMSREEEERSRRLQKAMLSIKQKYGKNAVLRGTNFEEGATARERNRQIGGHKSGEE